ncbi:PR-1-like protein [Favolaschia claudopus]|uniref:PR-1-like protein n=1 Tax=Favolaschia claudopus TaxID=2862362 RepID=A0AAW0A8A6_9AGAR
MALRKPSNAAAYFDAHNEERSTLGVAPLQWNLRSARDWSSKCNNHHSNGILGPLGENLAAGTGVYSVSDAVRYWNNEKPSYDPMNPQPSHWTQVVWKETTDLGVISEINVYACPAGVIFPGYGITQYHVCEYWPAGKCTGEWLSDVHVAG